MEGTISVQKTSHTKCGKNLNELVGKKKIEKGFQSVSSEKTLPKVLGLSKGLKQKIFDLLSPRGCF